MALSSSKSTYLLGSTSVARHTEVGGGLVGTVAQVYWLPAASFAPRPRVCSVAGMLGCEAGGNHHHDRRSARRFPVEADHGSPKPRQTMADPQAGRASSAGGAPSGAGGAPFGSDDEDDEDEPMPRVMAIPESASVSARKVAKKAWPPVEPGRSGDSDDAVESGCGDSEEDDEE